MKDISLAHADSYQELNKFDLIDATDVLSVARYNCDSNREPLQPYLHKHSQYEFIIPIKTIHLIEYMNCKFIGEVGFCYPFESNEPHGFDHEMNKANFVSVVIDYDFYQSRLKEFHRAGMVFNNRFPVKKALVSLLKNFQDACRKEYPNDTVIETIAKEITDYIVINGYSKEKRRKLPQKEYDPNIRKTLSYMFVNFNNPDLNLTKLAFHCGYSVAYFSRVFK